VLDHLVALGVDTPNESGFPLVEIPLRDADDLTAVARTLLERGQYVTLAPYPGVPRDQVGFRIQMTAAHTDEQIDDLLDTLTALAGPVLRRV
jgi:8-amino-7-oxononanoate synthase